MEILTVIALILAIAATIISYTAISRKIPRYDLSKYVLKSDHEAALKKFAPRADLESFKAALIEDLKVYLDDFYLRRETAEDLVARTELEAHMEQVRENLSDKVSRADFEAFTGDLSGLATSEELSSLRDSIVPASGDPAHRVSLPDMIKAVQDRSAIAITGTRDVFAFMGKYLRTVQAQLRAPIEREIQTIEDELKQGLEPLEAAKAKAESDLQELLLMALPDNPSEDELEAEAERAAQGIQGGLTARMQAKLQYVDDRPRIKEEYDAKVSDAHEAIERAALALASYRESTDLKGAEERLGVLRMRLSEFDRLEEELAKIQRKLNRYGDRVIEAEVQESELIMSDFPPPNEEGSAEGDSSDEPPSLQELVRMNSKPPPES